MAMANIAFVLARRGFRTLIVDWDLEAPGLEAYYRELVDPKMAAEQPGVIDLLTDHIEAGGKANDRPGWRDVKLLISIPGSDIPLHMLTAGRNNEGRDYYRRVGAFDAGRFYRDFGGNELIESWRNEWKENYDFVLIDSRTGITDGGGICTIQMPDILTVIFTPNHKSLNGVLYVAEKALAAQQKLPEDRQVMRLLPIVSRFDVEQADKEGKYWLELMEDQTAGLYADWVPKSVILSELMAITKIPYNSFYSFGESLAVGERPSKSPGSLPYTYETLAGLIGNNLEDVDGLMENRDAYVRKAEPKKIEVTMSVPIEISAGTLSTEAEDLYNEMLEQHRRWVDSGHKEGEQLKVDGGDWSKMDFLGANLQQAFFKSVKFRNADFTDADLSAASLLACDFSGATFRQANLSYVQADKAHFTSSDMTGFTAENAGFSGANFQDARLDEANLRQAMLLEANLQGASLKSASLVNANLDQADLREADLPDADLSGASLRRAKMQGAYVGDAVLDGADLSDCDLSETEGLRSTQFRATNLSGAKLSEVDSQALEFVDKDLTGQSSAQLMVLIPPTYAGATLVLTSLPFWESFFVYGVGTMSGCGIVLFLGLSLLTSSPFERINSSTLPAIKPDGVPSSRNLGYLFVGLLAEHSPLWSRHLPASGGGRTLKYSLLIWASAPVLLLIALAVNYVRGEAMFYLSMWAFGPEGVEVWGKVWPTLASMLLTLGVIVAATASYARTLRILQREPRGVRAPGSSDRQDRFDSSRLEQDRSDFAR